MYIKKRRHKKWLKPQFIIKTSIKWQILSQFEVRCTKTTISGFTNEIAGCQHASSTEMNLPQLELLKVCLFPACTPTNSTGTGPRAHPANVLACRCGSGRHSRSSKSPTLTGTSGDMISALNDPPVHVWDNQTGTTAAVHINALTDLNRINNTDVGGPWN